MHVFEQCRSLGKLGLHSNELNYKIDASIRGHISFATVGSKAMQQFNY